MPDSIIDTGEKRINEAVCIDTKRIYDSCVSKDCLEDLRVTFYAPAQMLVDNAVTVKCRDCTIEAVSIDVDEVPFDNGFYSSYYDSLINATGEFGTGSTALSGKEKNIFVFAKTLEKKK